MTRRLLVPSDGSELAERALVIAGDLAESLSGKITLAPVVPPPVPERFSAPKLPWQVREPEARNR